LNNRCNSINNASAINSGTSTLERSKVKNGVETIFVIHHGVLQQVNCQDSYFTFDLGVVLLLKMYVFNLIFDFAGVRQE